MNLLSTTPATNLALSNFYFARTIDNEALSEFGTTRANSLTFLVDRPGAKAVYPYHDEAADLLKLALETEHPGPFEVCCDCFCGGGHSLLPIIRERIAIRGVGLDINPRAITFANTNADLNFLGIHSTFAVADTAMNAPKFSQPTLYIASAPFALTVQGKNHEMMRDGGANGLELTEKYIVNAYESAKAGDVIIGTTYCRLGMEGLELELLLEKVLPDDQKFECGLLENRKLWRNWLGEKNQENPMPILNMPLKVDPSDIAMRDEYRLAAEAHFAEGWSHIAYCYFRIVKE